MVKTIEPAFQSRTQALVMLGCLLATLLLPLALPLLGLPSRAEVYRGIPTSAGPFNYIGHEIYEEQAPIDVLFIGGSILWTAIDATHVQAELSTRLRRPAVVRVFGANWPGLDLSYVLLRDVLERRKVGLVVLFMRFADESDRPHAQAFRWLRVGDDPLIFEGQSLRSRMAVYAATVLGGPRQLLTRLRPNISAPEDKVGKHLGGLLTELGFHGEPFVKVEAQPPAFSTAEMIGRNPTEGWFRVTNNDIGPYQLHFVRMMGDLLRAHSVRAAFLYVPMWSDRGSPTVNEAMNWAKVFQVDAAVIGIPGAALFAPISPAEQRQFYYNEHMNRNGAGYFTHAITPAILEYFDGIY